MEFYADMGRRPEGMSLERIDNDGNYEPGNVRWATQKEQMANRRDTHRVSLHGRTVTLMQAAQILGVPHRRFSKRMYKKSCSAQAAVDFYAARVTAI